MWIDVATLHPAGISCVAVCLPSVGSTNKPIYGHQEAAKKGYNPTKPGRPSLAYHSYFIAATRVCLDVDVESGDHAAAKYGYAALWRIIDDLPPAHRPEFIRGDCAYGEEKLMSQCEQRGQKYLFKLRQSPRVKDLIKLVTKTGNWTDAGQGFEGVESRLKLKAWTGEAGSSYCAGSPRTPHRRRATCRYWRARTSAS